MLHISAMRKGPDLTRRGLLAGTACLAAAWPFGRAFCRGRRPVVVELFTSQGCSSCPPADRFLGELARRPDVLPLSLNVDYWDYLGWRDTLGSSEFTKRQRDYAQRRGDGQVYTPQIVIDGGRHFVGSKKKEVLKAIGEAEAGGPKTVEMSLREHGDETVVEIAAAPEPALRRDSTVWVLTVKPRVSIEIERGENTGRTIDYTNVVRRMMPAGMWNGDALTLKLPRDDLYAGEVKACAALLQVGGVGPIIGAAWKSSPAG
jgi:hypothetical protein